MAIGPGKYDFCCKVVREMVGLGGDNTALPGGVIVIVYNGDKGHGFSIQADLETTLLLPDALENMAKIIRANLAEGIL